MNRTRRPILFPVGILASLCLFASVADAAPRTQRMKRPPSGVAVTPFASGNFTYQGGPVMTHVEVVVVLWGPSVDKIVTDNIANFYTAETNGALMDWMGEYDTVGQTNGTKQHVYHGKYLETVTITPAKVTGTITDSDIQNELTMHIMSGLLPTPQADPVEGHVNTIYAVYFPPGLTIDDGTGSKSCGSWCAYHGSITYTGLTSGVPYSVIPDFSKGGCSSGCGGNSPTEGMTCTSAHEMLEAVSDPDNAQGTWLDGSGNEICDVCNNCDIVAGFSVQQCWSQRLGQCISTDANLPLCNGTTRPCRSCTPADCTGATPTCVTDPLAPNAGECATGAPPPVDGGSGSSSGSGSSGSSGSSSSGGSSGTASGSSGSSSGGSSGTGSGSGGSGSGGVSSSGSGTGSTSSGGTPVGGSSGASSGSGDDGGANDFSPTSSSSGCACESGARGGSDGAAATFAGLLLAGAALVRRPRARRGTRPSA
jgi:hypothetical protein